MFQAGPHMINVLTIFSIRSNLTKYAHYDNGENLSRVQAGLLKFGQTRLGSAHLHPYFSYSLA